MDYLKSYFSEHQINLDPSQLEYLTVIPKDIQKIVSKFFHKDVILFQFLDHLIDTCLVDVSYDREFLNIPLFKSKILQLLHDKFGNPFDFSEYGDIIRNDFVEIYGQKKITEDQIAQYFDDDDIEEIFDNKLRNLDDKITNLFKPKSTSWDSCMGDFGDIHHDLVMFVIDNLRADGVF